MVATLPSSYPPLPLINDPVSTLPSDASTSDNWVKRDKNMIRLTGSSPCNAEAPLLMLYNSGFLTPSSYFYVRTHGNVPKVEGDVLTNWRLSVCGLISKPLDLSLQDLKTKFNVVTLPVTLVCAGNRRKEQNIVGKSVGFDFGPGAVSTALFTGVYLADILDYVIPTEKNGKRPAHVVFEGVDMLPKGPYGTSQRLSWAQNKAKGMMVAWAMNGLPLIPDHGFPLRVIVPGQVGGRSVKWLHKIEVSDKESQHYLHFHDNKILPTQLTVQQANDNEAWWHDPKYIITDLDVNAAVVQPAHNEEITSTTEEYTIKGYAYSGGGRRVTRVEISLDEAQTWTISDLVFPEDLYRKETHSDAVFGTIDLTKRDDCFCWCFWSLKVKVADLKKSGSIQVRAMDEGLGVQPRDMYWNVTGMMNNWWFRVAILKKDDKLQFEHPVMPGLEEGGWMARMKAKNLDILNPIFTEDGKVHPPPPHKDVILTNPKITKKILASDIAGHNWFVVKGNVYDATSFENEHPGGKDAITSAAGKDASAQFLSIHPEATQGMIVKYHIGILVGTVPKLGQPSHDDGSFISHTDWKKVKLVEVKEATHDTRYYQFAFEDTKQLLGVPLGQYVMVRASAPGGGYIQRAYTPVTMPGAAGRMDLLIKLYLPNGDFPGGKMSCILDKMKKGDTVEIMGPLGSFYWENKGMANWKGFPTKVKNVGMICGGSGITPIIQVLRGIFLDSEDTETNVWMIDSNKTEKDILCRQELDELVKKSNGRFTLHHMLNGAPAAWEHMQGQVNFETMVEHFHPSTQDASSVVLICGPPSMVTDCENDLAHVGWDVNTQVVVF